jgi:hypothetical protein
MINLEVDNFQAEVLQGLLAYIIQENEYYEVLQSVYDQLAEMER